MAAVLGVVIISFGIWGIGDIFRGVTQDTVAKVGSTEITGDQFRQIFNDRLQQLSRQLGRPLTPDQARAIGYDQQLLRQLIAEAALDQRAQSLRLGISPQDIARRIKDDPAFRGITGEFDQSRFEQLIRQAGYTEPRYVAEQRRVALRRQMVSALSGGVTVPSTAIEALNRYQNEERSADYVTLTAATAGDIGTPSTAGLQKYFDDRKVMFRAPEYRKVLLLSLNPTDIASGMEIGADEIKRAYESRLARYSTPERRDIQQILFPNEDEARKAADKIASGTSFDDIANERGLKPSDISLGFVTKTAVADPAIADAAFGLKVGEISAPVKGRFGVALLRVNKVEPATVKSLADVEGEIKNELALERAKAEVSKRRDQVEDELASGLRLDEVAQKLAIPVRTIAAVDRSGRDANGNVIPDLAKLGDIVQRVFDSDVGVENDPIQAGGGFVWYEVAGTTPARDRNLDEVKSTVEARWRQDEIAARLQTKAADMVEKLKGGATLKDLAAADGLKVEMVKGVKRRGAENVPEAVVSAMFKTDKGGVGSADGKDAEERVVFQVTDITTPPFDRNSEEAKRLNESLRTAIADDLIGQYVEKTETDLGTTINAAALAQSIGARTN